MENGMRVLLQGFCKSDILFDVVFDAGDVSEGDAE
jgi:hypothetical protein